MQAGAIPCNVSLLACVDLELRLKGPFQLSVTQGPCDKCLCRHFQTAAPRPPWAKSSQIAREPLGRVYLPSCLHAVFCCVFPLPSLSLPALTVALIFPSPFSHGRATPRSDPRAPGAGDGGHPSPLCVLPGWFCADFPGLGSIFLNLHEFTSHQVVKILAADFAHC